MNIQIVEIDVTQKHINEGTRRNCAICPVSLAMTDNEGLRELHPRYIKTYGESAIIVTDKGRLYVNLPSIANSWINIFDELGPKFVSPFKFPIEIIVDYM